MKFKLYETGEWDREVDWDYTKENPDDDSEEANWIKYLESQIISITEDLINPKILEIIDIRGFDMYQGPYASVKIFDHFYKIWNWENFLWIENFPIDNTGDKNNLSGYKGTEFIIANLLNEITNAGGMNLYLIAKKYNL